MYNTGGWSSTGPGFVGERSLHIRLRITLNGLQVPPTITASICTPLPSYPRMSSCKQHEDGNMDLFSR